MRQQKFSFDFFLSETESYLYFIFKRPLCVVVPLFLQVLKVPFTVTVYFLTTNQFSNR